MTDNEIKKALECWIKNYDGLVINFITLSNALDLINRLETKNSNLTSDLTSLQNNLTSLKAEKEVFILAQETLQERIDFLEAENYVLMEDKEKLKAENESLKNAYKQCAWERDTFHEELETASAENERLTHITRNLVGEIKAEAYTEFVKKLKETYGYYDWENKVIVYPEEINNLLKEMIGE